MGHKEIAFLETHMQYDLKNYICSIYISTTDLESDIANYAFEVSNGTDGVRT